MQFVDNKILEIYLVKFASIFKVSSSLYVWWCHLWCMYNIDVMNPLVFNCFLSVGDDIGFVALHWSFQKNIFFGYHYTFLLQGKINNELIRISQKN